MAVWALSPSELLGPLLMPWTAPTRGISMSVYGYKRLSNHPLIYDRS